MISISDVFTTSRIGAGRQQYTARTPLSAKNGGFHSQKGENWIRKSLHKEPFVEYENLLQFKKSSPNEQNAHIKYENMPLIKQRLTYNEETEKLPSFKAKAQTEPIQKRVAQHPIQHLKQYYQLQEPKEPQPQSHSSPDIDDLWRKVFLQKYVPKFE